MNAKPSSLIGCGLLLVIGLLSAGADAPAPAQAPSAPATAPAAPGIALTIYSSADPATFDPQTFLHQQNNGGFYPASILPGFGVVRENREINLNAGDNTIRFTDVASGIDPTTVSFQSLTDPSAASVLEQNYEYDLVSPDKLLAKYLDKEVRIRLASSGTAPIETIAGTLMSTDPSNIVLRDPDGGVRILARGPAIQSIELAKTDLSLITKPTLVWKIRSDKAGKQLAQVTYQTDQITWRADYAVTLNAADNAADISSWVTIMNQSGAAYPDAKLKLVAGDVHRIQPANNMRNYAYAEAAQPAAPAEPAFAEKSFFEYHLYTLGRTTSLNNNSTKQIELFSPKLNVPVEKTFVYYGLPQQWRYWVGSDPYQNSSLGTPSNTKVDIYLQIDNTEKNGLGIPLPAGRIRVYKRDPADDSKEFIGEDVIQHTPRDEKVMIRIGSAFDIVGQRKQTNFTANVGGRFMIESFEIKLRNHKKEPVHIIVKENLYRWSTWEITQASDKWEKQDSRTIHFPVDVPPDSEKTITYTVKYTW